MSEIKNFVNELVLGYFSKINASVHENNGLYEFTVPDNFKKIFRDDILKITFDENLSKFTNYELVSPGNPILSVILNECIKFGPTVIGKSMSHNLESPIIRFYFYVIFESIKSKTKILSVNIDTKNIRKIDFDDSEINFQTAFGNIQLDSELVDDCYVESIDYLEKSMTSEINNFKNEILELKNEELQNIDLEYKKKYKIIENKHTDLRSKNNSDTSLQKLIDEHESIKLEENITRKNLAHKYLISVDFALIGSIVFVWFIIIYCIVFFARFKKP